MMARRLRSDTTILGRMVSFSSSASTRMLRIGCLERGLRLARSSSPLPHLPHHPQRPRQLCGAATVRRGKVPTNPPMDPGPFQNHQLQWRGHIRTCLHRLLPGGPMWRRLRPREGAHGMQKRGGPVSDRRSRMIFSPQRQACLLQGDTPRCDGQHPCRRMLWAGLKSRSRLLPPPHQQHRDQIHSWADQGVPLAPLLRPLRRTPPDDTQSCGESGSR
mmetsp:Transcript_21276/g.49357  ORF Transcript_21276/g.49357 Transcript_21276/m.49357 type:complete len:217 (-) Transcript_21276:1444-2094(-)